MKKIINVALPKGRLGEKVANSLYSASVLASDKVLDNEERYENDSEADDVKEFSVVSGSLKTDGAAEGLGAGVHKDSSYYFTECERGDRKVVTAETESGETDKESAKACARAAHNESDDECENSVSERFNEKRCDLTAEVCADAHKSGMAERKLAKKAYYEAERHRENYFYSHFLKQISARGLEVARERKCYAHDNYERDSDIIKIALKLKILKIHNYTFSLLFLPRSPEGLTRRSMIRIENSIASV